jgi:hypothetical protein
VHQKEPAKSRSGRQPATQKHHGAQHQPWSEQRGSVKRSEPQHQNQTAGKATRKGPTAPTKCGGRSTTGLFNNRYL